MSKRAPWPTGGPEFNAWNNNLTRFVDKLDCYVGHTWWNVDPPLKYLNIRIDTRNNRFLLYIAGEEIISPNRVLDAIDKWMEKYGDA